MPDIGKIVRRYKEKQEAQLYTDAIVREVSRVFTQYKKNVESELAQFSQLLALIQKQKKGEKGERGRDGRDGRDGVGIQGEKGEDGRNGKDGTNGKDGKDGSPDAPRQIVEKINTLEQSIGINIIAGLGQALQALQSNIRSIKSEARVGGGMGMPVHQTFSGDGATTTFTLSNNVAADSRAAWVYYQGQFLVNSTHWSISGTTLSLTFTPDDGTNIDITYIRR